MNCEQTRDEYACAALSCLGCPDCTEFVQLFAFGGNNFIQGGPSKKAKKLAGLARQVQLEQVQVHNCQAAN